MDKLKKFLTQKKVDAKFKTAGKGHSLSEQASSQPKPQSSQPQRPPPRSDAATDAAKAAAAKAALARNVPAPSAEQRAKSRSQAAIKAQAKLELEQEAAQSSKTESREERGSSGPREVEVPRQLGDLELLFTCDLLGDSTPRPKEEIIEAVGEFLQGNLTEDPVVASSLIIHSLNKSQVKSTGVEVLCKYIDNILGEPDEEKYRRIRLSNKAFQERVATMRGGLDLLRSLGFEEEGEEGGEKFLVLSRSKVSDELLIQAREMLSEGKGVELELYRDPRVLRPGTKGAGQLNLPDSFFAISPAEAKEEQARRAEALESMQTLKTQEMRKREAESNRRRYKYCVMRVRFPTEVMLQGTFRAADTVEDLLDFVRANLEHDWALFRLKSPQGVVLGEGWAEKSLEEACLCPASTLTFHWDPEIEKEWQKAAQPISFLSPDILASSAQS